MSHLKPVRITVNIPAQLIPLVKTRMTEEHYHSASAYLVGLLLFDLVARSRHAITSTVMSDPPELQEKVFDEIVRDFNNTNRTDSGWFRHRVEEARRKESREKKKRKKKDGPDGKSSG